MISKQALQSARFDAIEIDVTVHYHPISSEPTLVPANSTPGELQPENQVESMTPLERKLIQAIRRSGPLTFRGFMECALYDPEFGYYITERLKIGPRGDFYTASNVHPAFGATLARAFVTMWRDGGNRRPLILVEMGAGTGRLAADVLAAIRDEWPDEYEGVDYIIVERSPAMVARQRELLAEFGERVRWRTLAEVRRAPLRGIVFSNELLDAMPVHRARWRNGILEEQFVGISGENLELRWDRPTTPRLARYVDSLGVPLLEDQIVEINLDAIEWLGSLSEAIEVGFLVTIDYGDVATSLYGPDRAHGTLRSFYRHQLVDSPLQRIGEQDMTASVNFSAIMNAGRELGFETVSYERQASFLLRHGLIELIARMHRPDETLDDVRTRLAIKNLFVPGGASDNFRVLVQRKLDPTVSAKGLPTSGPV